MLKSNPRGSGKWKRFGLGRRNNNNTNKIPEEEDHGANRSLSAKRNQRLATKSEKRKGGSMIRRLNITVGRESRDADNTSVSNPQSPFSDSSYITVESDLEEKKMDTGDHVLSPKLIRKQDKEAKERMDREIIFHKQRLKERDGFCRRVDAYDGNVIVVDQKPTYELGNYLGGGVAGVVYQGHRLRPLDEYPVRKGINDEELVEEATTAQETIEVQDTGFCCAPVDLVNPGDEDDGGLVEVEISKNEKTPQKRTGLIHEDADLAIEATMNQNQHVVMLDGQDAPSRSRHFTQAASVQVHNRTNAGKNLNHGLTDEAVAVKILNPVGYRILQADAMKGSVIVKRGAAMSAEVKKGVKPMEEKHVWWIVNPNSRNLRTLQRYNGKEKTASNVQVDRGSKNKGLRLSLIAAYIDPRTDQLRELTLTRCIEIWGHVPFDATEVEFEDMMTAIERVNAGHPPPPMNAFRKRGVDPIAGTDDPLAPIDFQHATTGLLRAALTPRATVFCEELNAYIAIPAVPSKYLRWLRQRRGATKEIRNMMSIGRHKNVLHLFEVLEFIQEAKSTMFLILELVKGGELFDLISSSAGKARSTDADTEEAERMMRKFFYELSSGINYCHKNGIAHRDLKPENLLVHNGADGKSTLKIADFGLSASFNTKEKAIVIDNDTLVESPASPMSIADSRPDSPKESVASPSSEASGSAVKGSVDKLIASGATALSFLTCGAMETVLCFPNSNATNDGSFPLRRMTSVVGSPHYVAPEIISQNEDSSRRSPKIGYDGAKADVWSAGVILYAMLFRSLPFGEDLLRCPRYQSYRKWYDEVRQMGGRRSSAVAALNPTITDYDEREYLGPHWFFPSTTSKESRDLIVAMLNPRPEERLSVGQILQHPWVILAAKGS